MTNLIDEKWKIFYRKINELGRYADDEVMVYPKEYINLGNAERVARKLFRDDKTYVFGIAKRDPWKSYSATVTCSICGREHEVVEYDSGGINTSTLRMYRRYDNLYPETYNKKRKGVFNSVCDECYDKILDFINSLKVKEEE